MTPEEQELVEAEARSVSNVIGYRFRAEKAEAEVQRRREQEARVRTLHQPQADDDGYQWCGYCSSLDSDGDLEREWSWPCATIRALDGGDDE